MKYLQRLEKIKDIWFIIFSLFIFFLLRFPSFFEPDWYGDEGIYQAIGMGLDRGRLLYQGVWDNKPPLLYLFYAAVNSNLPLIRILSCLFGMGAILCFLILVRRLFQNTKITYLTTGIFALIFGLPLLEGNIANAENFMLFPILLATLFIYKGKNTLSNHTLRPMHYTLFLPGLFLGLTFLFKVVAIFDFSAFLLFIIINNYKSKEYSLKYFEKYIPFLLGFITPISLTAIFFLIKHNFGNFFHSIFLSNIGYVNYGNKLIIPQGFLIIKLILLLLIISFLFYKKLKNQITPNALFIFLWFSFSLFNAFFSQRPYTHYLLNILPSFCLLIGLFFYARRKQKILLFILISIIFTILFKNFWFYSKSLSYYKNFVSFVTKQKTVDQYRAFFDKQTVRDYQIASFLKLYLKPKDNIFIWGDNAQLYYLTNTLPPGRFLAAYHVRENPNTIKETAKALQQNPPRFIILLPNQQSFPFSLIYFKPYFMLGQTAIYERTF